MSEDIQAWDSDDGKFVTIWRDGKPDTKHSAEDVATALDRAETAEQRVRELEGDVHDAEMQLESISFTLNEAQEENEHLLAVAEWSVQWADWWLKKTARRAPFWRQPRTMLLCAECRSRMGFAFVERVGGELFPEHCQRCDKLRYLSEYEVEWKVSKAEPTP